MPTSSGIARQFPHSWRPKSPSAPHRLVHASRGDAKASGLKPERRTKPVGDIAPNHVTVSHVRQFVGEDCGQVIVLCSAAQVVRKQHDGPCATDKNGRGELAAGGEPRCPADAQIIGDRLEGVDHLLAHGASSPNQTPDPQLRWPQSNQQHSHAAQPTEPKQPFHWNADAWAAAGVATVSARVGAGSTECGGGGISGTTISPDEATLFEPSTDVNSGSIEPNAAASVSAVV